MATQKQLIALVTELGIAGHIVDGVYVAPDGYDPESLELDLIIAGWEPINPGRYYTSFTPVIYRNVYSGIFHKNNMEVRVCWGEITSSKPASISLHDKPISE